MPHERATMILSNTTKPASEMRARHGIEALSGGTHVPPPYLDASDTDITSLMHALSIGDCEVIRWLTPIRLTADTDDVRGKVVRWWDESEELADRVTAIEILRPTWVREQSHLAACVNFYQQPKAIRLAVMLLRDRCDNAIHFEQQLLQLADQTAGSTERLAVVLARRDPYMVETLQAFMANQSDDQSERDAAYTATANNRQESELVHADI